MQGITAFPGRAEPQWAEYSPPRSPGPGEVLCRTRELGVCGTDRDILESAQPLVPPDDARLALGHECLAEVMAVGAGVDSLAAGDLVVPAVRRAFDPSDPRPDLLPFGSFTERGIVCEHGFSLPLWLDRPQYLFPVPAEIAAVAVLTEPLSVAEKGVQEATLLQRSRLGEAAWTGTAPRVLVTGQGPIAFACLLACRVRSWPVTMWGRDTPDTFRADLARRLGGAYRTARDFRPPEQVERDGFDLILECTGSDTVLAETAPALASCGVMVWLGSSRSPHPRPHNLDLLMRNAVLRNHLHLGTVNAAPRDFRAALNDLVQLQRTCPGPLADMITHRVPPEDALWHYRHRVPQGIKTVVMFDS